MRGEWLGLVWVCLWLVAGCGGRQEGIETRAERGDAEAQYLVGKGCLAQDQEHALAWLDKAAAQGYPRAEYLLATMYLASEGPLKSMEKGFSYGQRAAQKGLPQAENLLGQCFLHGWGTQTDLGQAAFWFDKAARQGLADAQYRLAVRYARGEGVPQSFSASTAWLERAARQGHPQAEVELGDHFMKGLGTGINYEQAYKWALIVGFEKRVKLLERRLKPAQLRAARLEAQGFRPQLELDPETGPESHALEWGLGTAVVVVYGVAGCFWLRRRHQRKKGPVAGAGRAGLTEARKI